MTGSVVQLANGALLTLSYVSRSPSLQPFLLVSITAKERSAAELIEKVIFAHTQILRRSHCVRRNINLHGLVPTRRPSDWHLLYVGFPRGESGALWCVPPRILHAHASIHSLAVRLRRTRGASEH